MRTMIRILQRKELVDERLHFLAVHPGVSLDCGFARHGGELMKDHLGRSLHGIFRKLVQNLHEKLLLTTAVQIRGHGPHRKGVSSKLLQLKTQPPEIWKEFRKKLPLLSRQIQNDRRIEELRGRLLR